MAGKVGNPYKDPETGKFTSASGLNRDNSTIGQRGKARVKEHISAAKSFAIGAVSVAAAGVGMALLQGITRPVRTHSTIIANRAINAGIDRAERIVATQGPKIASAIKAKGSTIVSHVKSMKKAGAVQNSVNRAPSPAYKPKPHNTSFAKPVVRVPMRTAKPVYRVPMGRK